MSKIPSVSQMSILDRIIKENASIANADHAIPNKSEKYVVINTLDVIDSMFEYGFVPTAWSKSDKEYGIHTVSFKQDNHDGFDVGNGDRIIPTVHLLNSNNKRASFSLNIGFYRLICSNGLRTFDVLDATKTKHFGHKASEIVEHFFESFDDIIDNRLDVIVKMDSIDVSDNIRRELVTSAFEHRYYDGKESLKKIITSPNYQDIITSVGTAQRQFDRSDTLWKVYNTIQENISNGNYMIGTKKAKPITSPFKQEVFNKKLWNSAYELV